MNFLTVDEVIINPAFDALLHPLQTDELRVLKESMQAEGWAEEHPMCVWGSTCVDGHNRYRIAQELGITQIPVQPKFFESNNECRIWMFRQQIGRRNTSAEQRSLYVGQLFLALKDQVGTAQAVREISKQENRSERQIYRDGDLSKVFDGATSELQQKFLSGELTAKELTETLKPLVAPVPIEKLSKEEQQERHNQAFPALCHKVSERTIIGVRNMKALCGDIDLVFKNQGLNLADYAPTIAQYWMAFSEVMDEAQGLARLVYQDGVYKIPELPEDL
jgi:hypothetical protein